MFVLTQRVGRRCCRLRSDPGTRARYAMPEIDAVQICTSSWRVVAVLAGVGDVQRDRERHRHLHAAIPLHGRRQRRCRTRTRSAPGGASVASPPCRCPAGCRTAPSRCGERRVADRAVDGLAGGRSKNSPPPPRTTNVWSPLTSHADAEARRDAERRAYVKPVSAIPSPGGKMPFIAFAGVGHERADEDAAVRGRATLSGHADPSPAGCGRGTAVTHRCRSRRVEPRRVAADHSSGRKFELFR